MDADGVRALALLFASRPSFAEVVAHLRYVTFSSIPLSAVTWYELDDSGPQRQLVLIAHDGLTADEVTRYSYIDPEFPMPASEALRHQLPFSMSVDRLADEFPLVTIRPELHSDGDLLAIPLTVDGFVRSVVLVTFDEPFPWNPRVWESVQAIQQLLCMYHRIMSLTGHGLRRPPRQLTVPQEITDRQRAILLLVEQRKSTSSIAARLGFSHSTVKKDVRQAMRVLEAPDRQVAAARAREMGLLSDS